MSAVRDPAEPSSRDRRPAPASHRGWPKPRLLHVTTTDMSLDWLLGSQLSAFAEAGYEVIGASAAGPHLDALRERGIEHVALTHATRSFDLRDDAALLPELIRTFKRLRPDIVHLHNPKPGVLGRVAGRIAKVPVVVNTQHGLYASPDDAPARKAVVYAIERGAALFSDAELVQSAEDRDVLARLRVPRSKLTVLGNGIDLSRFTAERPGERERVRAEMGVEPHHVVVGLVGRLVAEKGYREVVQAAHELRDRSPDVRFVIIGPAEPGKSDALSQDEIDAATRDGVIFLGRRDDVERYYLGMDLYVLASYREGFPRSAMEAAACGVPVIATDIRGCREVVDDGVNGLLVPARDAGAIARAVAELAGDADRRKAMSERAVAKARDSFDQQRQIDLSLETYARLLPRATR